MSLLQLAVAVIGLAKLIIEYLRERGRIDAETAAAALKGLRESDNAIKRAQAARDLVRADLERHPDRLRDDDGHRRD